MTKKNNGIIPEIKDERTKYVAVGCGKCMECMKKKKLEWQVRLLEEIKTNNSGIFVTLTFSEEEYLKLEKIIQQEEKVDKIEENEIASYAIRHWLELVRKYKGKSVKHWLITELGQSNTERVHIHGIVFTKDISVIEKWKYGNTWVGNYVNAKTINYIIKYVNKVDEKHKGYIPKIHTSPGIGRNYTKTERYKKNVYKGENTKEYYISPNGYKMALPIYYRNKLYNDEQREQLWINLLNKNLRYVGGEKIDISKNENDYFKTLEWYRQKNKRLGYGDDSKEWSKEEYKKTRKKFKYLKKIEKMQKNLEKPKNNT